MDAVNNIDIIMARNAVIYCVYLMWMIAMGIGLVVMTVTAENRSGVSDRVINNCIVAGRLMADFTGITAVGDMLSQRISRMTAVAFKVAVTIITKDDIGVAGVCMSVSAAVTNLTVAAGNRCHVVPIGRVFQGRRRRMAAVAVVVMNINNNVNDRNDRLLIIGFQDDSEFQETAQSKLDLEQGRL